MPAAMTRADFQAKPSSASVLLSSSRSHFLHAPTHLRHQAYGSLTALNDVSLDMPAANASASSAPTAPASPRSCRSSPACARPDSGTLTLDGAPLTAANVAGRTALGLVPQSIALYEDLSAEQNLRIFRPALRTWRRRSSHTRRRSTRGRATRRPSPQPGENFLRRHAAPAQPRCRAHPPPKLLLCDEPTVGVDPQSRNAIFDLLEKLNREGLTIIYSTHYMEEASRLCSRIGVIDNGKILALGTLDELLAQLPFEDEIAFDSSPASAAFAEKLGGLGQIATADGTHRFRPTAGVKFSEFYRLG